MISRPAFRYHGAKWRIAPWIICQFPQHECYCEPYGGSAGVLLRKPRSWLEVFNDKSEAVVQFFRVLREEPEALVEAIRWTPYAKLEWELAMEEGDELDVVERARRFYVRSVMSLAGPTAQWRTGWRRQKVISKDNNGKKKMTAAAIGFMGVEYLYQVAQRLRGVQIECDEALAVIERYDSPKTLFYLDPPYPSSVRGRWKTTAYEHEMTLEDHEALARLCHEVQGMTVISSYDSELYQELYGDWEQVARATRVNGAGSALEMLWLSPGARVQGRLL